MNLHISSLQILFPAAVIALMVTFGEAAEAPKWEIGTLDTHVVFSLKDGVPVVSELMAADSTSSHNWAAGTPEVELPAEVEIDCRSVDVTWAFVSATTGSDSLVFMYSSDNPRMTLKSTWYGGNGPGPVEHMVCLETTETGKVSIAPMPTISTSIRLPKGDIENWWVEKGSGSPSGVGTHTDNVTPGYEKKLLSGPHSSDGADRDAIPWFCLHDPARRQGVYGGIEFSGWTEIRVVRANDSAVVSLGLLREDSKPETRVPVSQTLELPICFIGVYKGDVDDGCNRLHRWVEKHLRPPMPGGVTPVLVNNSWGSGMAVDEDLAKRMIDDCARLGIELYHVDAGWYREVGDWHSNPEKLPHGLECVADYAHSKGLKFGLWVGWTQGGSLKDFGPDKLSVFNPEQKEWFQHDYEPDWHNHAWKGATVCLASKGARQWCLDDLRRMVKQYKLDLLEHDQPMIVDECSRMDHDHLMNDRTEVSRAAAEGYYAVYDQLRRENSDLLFEDCVSGGRLVDFGVVKRCHYICSTDVYDPLALRRAFYDASYPLPPSMIEDYIANHPGNSIASFKYMLRSATLGWATIMIDTCRWDEAQHKAAKREFDLYKSELRPLIADANVYHVLPRPDGRRWDGIQYADSKTGRGVLYIFRPDSDEETQTVVLKGLDPAKQYAVKGEDGSVSEQNLSGRELMESGLTIRLPENSSSDLVFITEKR